MDSPPSDDQERRRSKSTETSRATPENRSRDRSRCQSSIDGADQQDQDRLPDLVDVFEKGQGSKITRHKMKARKKRSPAPPYIPGATRVLTADPVKELHEAAPGPLQWTSVPDEPLTCPKDLTHILSNRMFSNCVIMQVNDVKFRCSGAVLAYHSLYFQAYLSSGVNLIVLENLECPRGQETIIEECLILMYGGGIIFSERNVQVIIRFSVVYQIEDMYRLAVQWVRNRITVKNVYNFWELGNEELVAGKEKKKKNDLLEICRTFIEGKEVGVAYEVKQIKDSGVIINREFLLMMMEFTDCTSIISDML